MSVSNPIPKWLRTLAKLTFSGLALFFVFNRIDIASLWVLLKQSNIALIILAGIFFIISKILSAFRLNFFFRSIGVDLPEIVNIKLYWLGMFYNLFLPGGIGGDGYKVYLLNREYKTPIGKTILATLFDRFTGLMALGLLCVIFSLKIPQFPIPDVYLIAATIGSVILLYYIVHKWFGDFYQSLNVTNLLALGTQVSQVICAYFILKALGNDHLTLQYIFVFLISSVVAIIPFTVGGIGAREVTFLYMAEIFNLNVSLAIALSLIFFMITALVSLYGILYIFIPKFFSNSINSFVNK